MELYKNNQIWNILDISPSQVYGLVQASIDDTERHDGRERLYTTQDIALLKIALNISKELRWPFRQTKAFCQKVKITGKGSFPLTIGGDHFKITVRLNRGVQWVEEQIKVLGIKPRA